MLLHYNNQDHDYDEQWSFKNFTNLNCPDLPDGITVYASSFYWEQPDYHTFRDDLKGVTFIKCNLDNIYIPPGNTVIDCHCRRFCCQADGNDWVLDKANKPTIPLMGEKVFKKFGLPVPRPEDIPSKLVDEAIDLLQKAREIKQAYSLGVIENGDV